MLKTIIFVLLSIVLSVFAERQLVAQLERVSATRARMNDGDGNSLELGIKDRAIVAAVFAAVMIVLGFLSRFWLISTILALAISVILVVSNTFLKSNGINALTGFFLLWIGILISSIKEAGFTTSTTGWGKVYIVLQIIMLVLLIVGSVAGNVHRFYCKVRQENRDADELEEKASKHDDAVGTEEDDEDDYEDDEDGFGEEDPFHEKFWNKAVRIGFIVLIVVFALVLGYWLEATYDFFPPYVS